MILYISAASPFVRKCRIVAREHGIVLNEVLVDPYADDPAIVAANPLVQVPALVAEDGLAITNSPLICEYLDARGSGPRLLPDTPPERLAVRRAETLADGLLEAAVKLLLETRRPESEQSPSWMARWRAAMVRSLDALEASRPGPEEIGMAGLDLGTITTAVALSWLDFRHPSFDWKSGRPLFQSKEGCRKS
ncbi:glutathione S-transferase, partial [Rhizobium sp. CRIBSB]|nr:glutathione S-transferase [Rhizobium sp. CRIBSB]